MDAQKIKGTAIVFFWTIGCICTASAIGADDGEWVNAAAHADEAAVESTSLFESDGQSDADDSQEVSVGSFGLIDLHVKDLALSKVLQLLSIQSQRNIVVSRNVSGEISADLYQVDFYEALGAILHTNGYGYREKGNFIHVYTAAEMEKIEAAERRTVTRVIRLNYLTAADASTYVSPLLSGAGSIAISGDVTKGFQPDINDGGENSNAFGDVMVITDYADNIDEIMAVLDQLDIRPKQVQVEATILQADLNEDNAFGIDLSAIINFDFDQFVTPLGVVDDMIGGVKPAIGSNTGHAVQTTVGNTGAGASGIKIGVLGTSVQAFIRALDEVTDTTLLAKPTILALNRQKANLLVGQRLGYLSTTSTETSTTQTIEFLDVGTQLTFRAFISDDDFIRMELRPSVSTGFTEVKGGFVIPEETTNELMTNVIVRSGQTIVLGGLFTEKTKVERKQVPVLGDIPLVGIGFRGQDDVVDRSEVIFLITPTVVKDEGLYAAGSRAADSIVMANMGAKQGLLPFSRTKMTASYMRDALEHYHQGNSEKALWAVNMALRLDPAIVEGLRLKEQLTGERTVWPDRSILKDAIDQMIERHVGQAQQQQALGDWNAQAVEIGFVEPSQDKFVDLAEQIGDAPQQADDNAPQQADDDPQTPIATEEQDDWESQPPAQTTAVESEPADDSSGPTINVFNLFDD